MTKTEGEGSGRGDRESAASTSRLPPGCFLHTSLFMRVLYIIFWPWGMLTFYDLGECKAVFHNLFFIVSFCLELNRKQKSCSLLVQQVAT